TRGSGDRGYSLCRCRVTGDSTGVGWPERRRVGIWRPAPRLRQDPKPMPVSIEVTRTRTPRPRPPAGDLGFGRFYSDHLFLAEHDGRGWGSARIVPYGPLPLDPASGALQYAQAMFEGMKAMAGERGPLLFRPHRHIRRFHSSARRLCMPEMPEKEFMAALRAVVHEDSSWVPTEPGSALYVRPTMVATEAYLGVRPSKKYLFYVLLSPVGNYFGPRPTPLRLW